MSTASGRSSRTLASATTDEVSARAGPARAPSSPELMPYRLREGLHWCQCAGRIVFLDLLEDRYSCLSQGATEAFLRLGKGQSRPEDSERLRSLIARRMLIETPGAIPWDRPARIAPVSGDLVHEPYPKPSLPDLIQAVTGQLGWSLLVRTRQLATIVRRLERRARRRSPSTQAASRRIAQLTSAFAAVSAFLPAEDRCLVRALALHALCCRHGIRPSLVFGVRMNPFRAHCWAQLGGKVLIGDFEQVRLFTPIAAFG